MSTALREVFARFTTRFDDRALKRGERVTNSLEASLKRLGMALVAYVGFNAVRGMITGFQQAGDELDKTSKVIGISTQALQAWRHAANLSGVDAQSFNTGLIRLQRNMYEAQRGSATAQEAFSKLGISVTGADGQLRSADEILREMADPLSQLESSTERVALLNVLMGRSGARIGPLFAQGAAGVNEMLGELERYGGGISQEAIQASADLTDAQARLDLAWTSLKSKVAVVLLPALQRLVETFTALVRDGRLLKALLATGLAVAARTLAIRFAALGTAGAVAGLKTMMGWAGIALVLAGIVLLADEVITTLEGGDSMLRRMAESAGEWMQAQKSAMEQWISDTRRADGLWAHIADNMRAVQTIMDTLGEKALRFMGFGDELDRVREAQEPNRQNLLDRTGGAVDINTAQGRAQAMDLLRNPERFDEVVAGARAAGRVRPGDIGGAFEAARAEGAAIRATAGAPVVSGQISIGDITINEASDAEQTRRVISEEMDRANREMVEALVPE